MSGPGVISEQEQLCLRGFWILNSVVADELRQLFRKLWDEKHPLETWQNNQASGEAFFKNHKPSQIFGQYDNKIKTGNLEAWDMTVLCRAFISYTPMNSDDSKYRDNVTILRDLRNTYAHILGASRQRVDYTTDIDQIRRVFTDLDLNEDELTKAENIKLSQSEIETVLKERMDYLKQELKEDQLTNAEFREYVQRQESFQAKVLGRLPVPGQGGFTQGGTDLEATEGGGQADQQDDLLPEWFRPMPRDQQGQVVTDKLIGSIAKHIGAEWELIAPEINISVPTREAIVAKHPRSIQLQVVEAFTTWKQINSRQATIASLIQILWQCNERCTIDWEGVEKVVMGDW
ncbi:uncharacterized protein LOC124145202 isoform X2 [Haliotis rufescens]|uniref:uncharacterized protein LOC124145202 isoform X2 n=1 Tax=Haliotis rufescens TaxID=6454 RepID=UPI001EB0957C|nr:uncharacterized protein LOC124145202 isoform X2 [Haliotis rufescens]